MRDFVCGQATLISCVGEFTGTVSLLFFFVVIVIVVTMNSRKK